MFRFLSIKARLHEAAKAHPLDISLLAILLFLLAVPAVPLPEPWYHLFQAGAAYLVACTLEGGASFYRRGLGKSLIFSLPIMLPCLFNLCAAGNIGFETGHIVRAGLVALGEEWVCRGLVLGAVLLPAWESSPGGRLTAVWCQAILFALAHLPNLEGFGLCGVAIQIADTLCLGVFFGAVFCNSRNIWGCVAAHAALNATAFASRLTIPGIWGILPCAVLMAYGLVLTKGSIRRKARR